LRSHKSAPSIVRNLSHVIVVPAAKSGDAPVVVTGVEHDQVDQLAEGEVPPDAKVVVHVYLSDRHPFEVCPDGVHLSLINADAAILDERILRVVEAGGSVAVAIVGHLVVVPNRDPGELLVREE
jgi:hypothetical protein